MAQQVKTGGKSKTKNAAPSSALPDKQKYDDEVAALDEQIKEKVAALKALGRPGFNREAQQQASSQLDKLYADLSKVRSEKETVVEERRAADDQIRQLNDVISKKADESNKLSATLRYKTIERVDEALARLERRKKKQQLSAQEETDIETEITELTNSKASISAYNESREEIEKERKQQNDLRSERDSLSERLSKLRLQEDEIRTEQSKIRRRTDQEKQERKAQTEQHDNAAKELDALYAQRKEKMASFRQMKMDFHLRELNERDAAMAKRDEERRKARQERAMEREGRQKEQLEYAAANDQNLSNRQVCQSLIAYLQRMATAETNGTASSGSADSGAAASGDLDSLTPVRGSGAAVAKPGAFLQRKTAEEDSFYAATAKPKKGKKNRKSGGASAKAASRPIKHNAIVLEQFLTVGVQAPSSQSTVPAAIQSLKDREAELTRQLLEKYGRNAGLDLPEVAGSSDSAATAAPLTNGHSTEPETENNPDSPDATEPVCNGDA